MPSCEIPAGWLALGAVLFLASEAGAVEKSAPRRSRPAVDTNTCLTCHLALPDKRLHRVAEAFQTSVHRDERIGCAGCHQGNPRDPTVQAHDPQFNFVVRPARDQIPALCGGCHEDPVFIRQFNTRLPIDQRRLYALSTHGKLVAEADPGAPTCVDCHGSHAVLRVDSAAAPVNRRQVVRLCEKCHADPEHMRAYGTPTDQAASWRKSVHGRAFLSGNDAAPTCSGCHSPHSGALGGISVAAACGRCHAEERRLFLASPHARPFRELGLAQCVPCHGEHDVSESSWLFGMSPESACSRCHARSVKPKQVAERIGSVLAHLSQKQKRVQLRLERAQAAGLHAPNAVLALAQARSGRLQLSAKTHDLSIEHLNAQASALGRLVDRAQAAIDSAERARKVERRGYYAALAVSALLLLLLVLKSVQLSRRRARRSS